MCAVTSAIAINIIHNPTSLVDDSLVYYYYYTACNGKTGGKAVVDVTEVRVEYDCSQVLPSFFRVQ